MQIINPKHYGAKGSELQRFSNEFNHNCKITYVGWAMRQGFQLKDLSPHRYFDVCYALGQYIRTTKLLEPYVPKKIS